MKSIGKIFLGWKSTTLSKVFSGEMHQNLISAMNIEWLAIYLNWKVMLEFVEKQVEDIAKQMKDIA